MGRLISLHLKLYTIVVHCRHLKHMVSGRLHTVTFMNVVCRTLTWSNRYDHCCSANRRICYCQKGRDREELVRGSCIRRPLFLIFMRLIIMVIWYSLVFSLVDILNYWTVVLFVDIALSLLDSVDIFLSKPFLHVVSGIVFGHEHYCF